jgi:NAD(P)-dependent dehydrogenase (short-subunit alcohol dehydrogenase family)
VGCRYPIDTLNVGHARPTRSRQGIRNYGADPAAFEKSFVDLTPLGRISRPEDITAFAYILVRDEFFETGQIFNYSGGNSLLGHPRSLA